MRHEPPYLVGRIVGWLLLFTFCAALWSCSAQAQSIFADGFEAPECPEPPDGFKVFERPWESVWYGASWPHGPAFQAPIGSWTMRRGNPLRGMPIAGWLITTPFVLDEGVHKIAWLGVQSIPPAGYRVPQAARSVTATISTCRADWASACQATARSGRLNYGRGVTDPDCRFQPGAELWMTWHFAQSDFDPTTNTCYPENPSGGLQCDAMFEAW